jgi:hypothetical protein
MAKLADLREIIIIENKLTAHKQHKRDYKFSVKHL